jgi:hypothetical protein
MQFGVKTDFAKTALPTTLALEAVTSKPRLELNAAGTSFPYNGASSALIVNRLLKAGAKVTLTHNGTEAWISAQTAPAVWSKATEGFDVGQASKSAAGFQAGQKVALNRPRIAIYQSYDPSMDEGWTRYILDEYGFEYTPIHNADVKKGNLRQKFDAVILPDQRVNAILEGNGDFKTILPEYRGGIGEDGLDALKQFVSAGGTLVALGEASNLVVEKMPVGVKDLKHSFTRDQHFAPGTVVNLQVDTASPIGWGAAPDTWAYYINSPFFQLTEGFASQKVSVVARYPNTGVNASGWLRGEDLMYGRAAVVSVEMNPGKIVLFGIRPQHRAQTHATLPLLFNALYWSAEEGVKVQ